MICKFRRLEPSFSSMNEKSFESRRVRTQPCTRTESMGVALWSASLIGVMDLTSANCRMIAIRQAKRRCLFQRVEISVSAAEVTHTTHDEWRRKNSTDADLLIVGYNR